MIDAVLLVKIGASISKQLVAIWGAKDTLQGNVAGDLSDYFLGKAADAMQARRAGRAFAELGDRMAENLAPLFEDGILDKGGVSAVTDAVTETIAGASMRDMIDADMDADAISARMLGDVADQVKHFSADEYSLYERCVRACVVQITELVAKSPDFVGAAVTEVLRRQSALLAQIDDIKESLVSIAREAVTVPSPDGAFEERYRRAVADNLDRVDLFGLDLRQPLNKRQKLSLAYTGLSSLRKIKSDKGDDDEIVPVEQLVMASRRLLIGGQPGSGKTTLLRWIAINVAGRKLLAATDDPMDRISFYIPFRQCDVDALPDPDEFVRFAAPALTGAMPSGWVHRCLDAGRGIILIDSVDEIPAKSRAKARDWLDDLMRTYPDNQYTITSRPYAFSGAWQESSAFASAELQPMEVADIHEFIDRWHAAVEKEMRDEGEIEGLEDAKGKLKAEIEKNIALRHVATNPLLCAALCALNRDRNETLPTDRIEIYDAFCDMLLERRDTEQELSVVRTDYPHLTLRQKNVLIEDLAYHMLDNGWVSIGRSEALGRIERKLPSITNVEADPSNILRLFLERSGIVREVSVEDIDFTHRTLQEFLTARAIKNEGDWGKLVPHAGDDRWREVIILATGIAPEKRANAVITDLLETGDRDPSVRYQRHLLAVACLDTTVVLSPAVQERVKNSLATIIPPAIPDDVRIIAAARDLVVPHLSYKPDYTAQQACDCVRALALIGSEAAMDAIKTYEADKRAPVLRAVIRAAWSFQTHEYFRRVLRHFNVRVLNLQGIRSLKGLDALIDVEELSIDLADNAKDLSPLTALGNLRKLDIKGNDAQDYSPLATLKGLQSLSVDGPVDPAFFATIQCLSTLQKVVIRNCGHVRAYSPLGALSDLRVLELERCDHMADVSFLSPLQRLEQVALRDLGVVRDLTPLSRLTQLTHLELRGLDRVLGFAFLRPLTGIRSLLLSGSRRPIDVSSIGDITHLTRLGAYDVNGITDLSFLSNLVELESLELACAGGCRLDVAAMARLVALENLQLRGFAHGDDISFVGTMGKLKVLVLDGSDDMRDVSALKTLTMIRSMYLSGFRSLSDISPLGSLHGLRVNVLIWPSEPAGLPELPDEWGVSARGGLRVVDLAAAKRMGFHVYSPDSAIAHGLFAGKAKIIEARGK